MSQPPQSSRWYPTSSEVGDAASIQRSFRRVLDQLYALQSQHDTLKAQMTAPAAKSDSTAAPAGSGPTDTMLCGLRVAPVDTQTLANGATLKYVKAQGNFAFS